MNFGQSGGKLTRKIGFLFLIVMLGGCSASQMGVVENQREDGVGQTVVGRSVARVKDGKCMEQLRQVRQAIELAKINGEDQMPQTIAEMRLPSEMQSCPIGKEPYKYDPATATVSCEHPGHDKY